MLVLTNAMLPMQQKNQLLELRDQHGTRLKLRVLFDHHTSQRHEELRAAGSWGDDVDPTRTAYGKLFQSLGIPIDADDPVALVLFPEMDASFVVP